MEANPKTKKITIDSFINQCISACSIKDYSFAVFVLPGKSSIQLIAGPELPFEGKLETTRPGFLFAPFDDQSPARLIEAKFHSTIRIAPDPTELALLADSFSGLFEHTQDFQQMQSPEAFSQIPDDYITNVKKAIQHIHEGLLKKVVVARNKIIDLPDTTTPGQLFKKLSETFDNSFRSLIHSKQYGTWIGASPEVLISIENNTLFSTVALAGTQRLPADGHISEAVWKQKEIEEQALVSRYIISCFKSIRLREFEEEGPKTIKAGELLHLKTIYSVNLTEVNIPDLGTQMLRLLHPTSAVGGMPRQEAFDFIRQAEKFDRQLFAGYIGPVNIRNHTNLFVNIRCARLYQTKAVLFAGAGITEESDPEKELAETEIKMNVIASVLHSEN